ncbi:MAG: 4-hydroxy-tetrahydrodipicolinate synthase [Neisseriales bacterium]|nr:MAG: 4-hydroxy-tetrahydrodipicolinate synthase [Neisseriales bacterium]
MLTGSIVALITPMQQNGQIDYVALKRLIDWHIVQGTDGIVLGGTTGESVVLEDEEYRAVIEFVVQHINGRIPVIVGAGGNSTHATIRRVQQAKEAGAQSVLSVVPYYNKPNQEGIYQHFACIADAVKIPLILYNVPSRTASDIQNETVLRLAQIPNIVGLKDATANLARACELMALVPKDFALYSGDDATAMAFILCGGHGAVSVCANIVPHAFRKMCHAALSGEINLARQQDSDLRVLYEQLFMETNPSPVKWALHEMGFIENVMRLPLIPISPHLVAKLTYTLRRMNLIKL